MQALAGAERSWWAKYLGRVGALIGAIYPAGRGDGAMTLRASWFLTKKDKFSLMLSTRTGDGKMSLRTIAEEEVDKIEKAGKKKNWIAKGNDSFGFKITIQ